MFWLFTITLTVGGLVVAALKLLPWAEKSKATPPNVASRDLAERFPLGIELRYAAFDTVLSEAFPRAVNTTYALPYISGSVQRIDLRKMW